MLYYLYMHRYIIIYCISISIALAPFTIASAAEESTGFITRNFWYIPETFYPDDTVRFYAALMNVSGEAITGTVTFYVDNSSIGTRSFAMRESDAVLSVWYDWKATDGEHSFHAKITETSRGANTSTSGGEMLSISTSVTATAKKQEPIATRATTTETSTNTSTTTPSVEHYTAKIGEGIDSVADTLRTKLENARDSIDSKLAKATSTPKAVIPRVLGDSSSTELFQQVVTGDTSEVKGTWYLRATRSVLSGAIGLLSHPLGVSFVILLSIFILVKLIQFIWRKITFKG